MEELRCPLALSLTIVEVYIAGCLPPVVPSYCKLFSARRLAKKDFGEEEDNTVVKVLLLLVIRRSIWVRGRGACGTRKLNL
jgi:hypothetical protein